MKRFFALTFMLLPVVAQPKPGPAKTNVKAAPRKSVAPSNTEIPAGAVEVSPNIFNYTDPAGKKWVYYRLPYGISKTVAPPGAENTSAQRTDAAMPEATVTEQGDSLKFVRPGPFGNYTWVKKKAELDDLEKETYEEWRKKTPQSKADTAPKKER